jgi:hypothetical protein
MACHCCWWCTLEIKGEELNLPYKQDNNGKIRTMGKFCSWECIKSYNIHENKLKFGNIQGLITKMRQDMYGKITRLACAPDRYLLKKFGGPLTENEFRGAVGKDPLPQTKMPHTENFLHYDNFVTEKYVPLKGSTEAAATEKISKIQNSKTAPETLKLKRPIPIKCTENNLERAMGIIRRTKQS